MKSVSELTILCIDTGLFVETARRLAKDVKKVYYWTPWESSFPKMNQAYIGYGIEGIERVDSPFGECLDEADLVVFIHGLIEAYLCSRHGIGESTVNEFDHRYKGAGEPGDEVNCPYREEHKAAMRVEKYLCKALEYDWKMHEFRCEKAFVERFSD